MSTSINFDPIAGVAGDCTLFGVKHDVLSCSAPEQLFATVLSTAAQEAATVERLQAIVARIVPTLTREQIDLLPYQVLAGIYSIGARTPEMIEALFPNGLAPSPAMDRG